MSEAIIECKELTKTYYEANTKIEVLRHIDISVNPGEMIAIVGNSGSGKSTLLHLLAGLDKPTAGEIRLMGKNLNTLKENERCALRNIHLGFVYQFHHLLPEFSALENVGLPLLLQSISPKIICAKAQNLLETVGLKDRLHHKVSELSGGERQRVAIARALIVNPKCILADEPTGNLDAVNADKVLQLFMHLQKVFQTSVVMVTHDIRIAQHAARLFILRNGMLARA